METGVDCLKEKEQNNNEHVVLRDVEFSKCGLCHHMPVDARILKCFHSFCLHCLEEYTTKRLGNNFLSCPLCGCDTALKSGDISGIPRNPYLLDTLISRLLCDLCENEREAEATCFDCGEKLCAFCHESHKNSKASKHHRIKAFVTKFEQTEHDKIVDEKDMCLIHETEERDYYCRKCQLQICKLCRNEEHKGHRTRPLSAFVSTKRRELLEGVDKIKEGYIDRLKRKILEVSKQVEEMSSSVESVLTVVAERAEQLKQEIDKIRNILMEDIKSKEKSALLYLEKAKSGLNRQLLASGGCVQYIQNVVTMGTDRDILSVSRSVDEQFQEMQNGKLIPDIEETKIEFETGDLRTEHLQTGFGHCTVRSNGPQRSRSVSFAAGEARDLSVQLVASFDYPQSDEDDDCFQDESVHALVSTSTGEAWVCCGWESTKLALINNTGNLVKQIDIEARIDDVTKTKDGGMLLSCFRDYSVKKLDKNLEISKLFKMPFYPRGLAISADGGLLVCMTDEYSTSVLKDSRRLVAKYSESGELIKSFENDGNRRLFTRPYRVAENINGDICVTDKTSMGAGRLVVLDEDGNLKYIYEGHTSNGVYGRSFSPAGLCCDLVGRILVADSNNHSIHILDKSGQFIGHLLTREDGLNCPHSLSLDPNGYLWVGEENGSFKVYLYL